MVGIGVEIEACPQGAKILKAWAADPADATLKRGDIITGVDSRPVAGLDLNQVADLLGGAAGHSGEARFAARHQDWRSDSRLAVRSGC